MYCILYCGVKLSRVCISSCDSGYWLVTDRDNSNPMYFEHITEVWHLLTLLSILGYAESDFEIIFCEV